RTFDTPGIYPYVCEPHETDYDMKGVVRVVP
ncbi:MAG: plastocyanin, partial [Gammaproteobacteria bacterium]|nr:plastocyanin [Gammaproteobacteria bacterium]